MDTNTCKSCEAVDSKKWYDSGTLCLRCYQKQNRAKNAERERQKAAEKRKNNPEKYKAYAQKSYLAHREKRIKENSDRAKAKHLPVAGKCKVCGKDYIGRKGSTCCSDGCRTEMNRQRCRKKHVPVKHDNVCEICGTTFVKSTKTKFCSQKCYSEHKTLTHRHRYQTDLNFRVADNIRSRLANAIVNKSEHTIDLLGCTWSELRGHLESLFQSGMTWDNYAKDGWHIDHKTPLSWFDLSDPEQLKKACHYTNLQPMWAEDNHRKGNRFSDGDLLCQPPKTNQS